MKFEEAVRELEEIVKKIEGVVSLDDSLALYEKGVKLCNLCMQELDKAKGKLSILTPNGEENFEVNK